MNEASRLAARRCCAGAVLLACAAGAAADPTRHIVATPQQQFQLGLESQAARDYGAMLAWYRRAAEAGHVEAQEALGLALLAGPVLYGGAVAADRCEAAHWLRRAALQGSEVGVHQITTLNRLRNTRGGRCG